MLKLDQYKKALDTRMRELLAQGLMEWLSAVEAVVPVWSGASRATFIKLGQLINYQVSTSGGNAPFRREETGLAMSTAEGFDETNTSKGYYAFTYGTTLPWLIVNEYNDATQWGFNLINPGPYDFQNKAKAKFLHATKVANLPLVTPFMAKKPIK